MSQSTLSELRTRLYLDFLQSLALEDPSFTQDIIEEITLGTILAEPSYPNDMNNAGPKHSATDISPSESCESNYPRRHGTFQESELLAFGTSPRHHLDLSIRRKLVQEVQATLHSITEFFCGDQLLIEEDTDLPSTLPKTIQAQKNEIEDKRQEISLGSRRITELILQITQMCKDLDEQIKEAISTTLPTHDATRSSSVDLLAATIETSLVRLSLTRARSERALYNHEPHKNAHKEGNNMTKAIAAAYSALKKDEKEMKNEGNSLDRKLQEYESLLQLVDGGKGGYQQIINDWTKVKQETDECLRDLRRLGWTGD
ncbi:hypothetical protein BDZ97DRAFT_501833 [Flammula alnicola]|nr:hypothetical protein BDZ97DRAFT_501833 [Flammula alnicola]